MAVAQKIDYLTTAAEAADKVYVKIVALACTHKSGAKTYAQLVSSKTTICAAAASIAYQEAGILPGGKLVSHRDAVGGSDANILKKKSTVAKAMSGAANIPKGKADVGWVGKKYAGLPGEYRRKGVMYIQDSNVCICAGGGAIYSCNASPGSQLDSEGRYKNNKITSGYAFKSPILVVIVPKEVSSVTDLNIIDVSRWNGRIDWAKAAKKIDGVVIRAGYRGAGGSLTTDPLFLQHIRGAISAGVKRIGVYWWTTHTTIAQAEADAVYLIKLLKPHKEQINFGVWLDSEASGSVSAFNKLSARNRTSCGKAFLAVITAAGYRAGVYASDSWFGTHLILSKLSAYPFWVAKYSSQSPKVVKGYAAWQHTSKGSVDGIKGYVDKSCFYTDLSDGATAIEEVHDMDTLRNGDKGQQVEVLQKLLGGITIDGSFGAKTEAVVEAYQTKNKLTVDGIVGSKTWDKLLSK